MSLRQLPAFTFRTHVEGARNQSVANSDRPVCAASAALASILRGEPITGAGRGMMAHEARSSLLAALEAKGVPEDRAMRFARSVNLSGLVAGMLSVPVSGKTLAEYQQNAVSRMTEAGGVLGMAVGLGKTISAIAAAREYVTKVVSPRCWIMCPLNAMGAWKPYLDDLKAMGYTDVKLLSMDSAHKFVGAPRIGGLLIVDEAHLAGRMAARRTKSLFTIRYGFDTCLCLTGTMLHGGLEKALTVLDLAIPGATGFATRWSAAAHYGVLVKKRIGSRVVNDIAKPHGASRSRLNALLARYTACATKEAEEVKKSVLIPSQWLREVEFGGAQESATETVVRIARAVAEDTGSLPEAMAVMHMAMRDGIDAKLAWLLDQMEDEPVVVFAAYHESLDAAEAVFEESGVSWVRVDGSVTGDDRIEAVRRFQAGEVQVFLGQIDAAGASIDLFRSHVSVALDLTLRATNYAQALGRTCRRGQVHECYHFDLIANKIQAAALARLRSMEDFNADFTAFVLQYQQEIAP